MASISNPPSAAELTVAETTVFTGTSPGSWTDLDLSAVVGAKSALVILKVTRATTQLYTVCFRKNGETDEFYENNTAGLLLVTSGTPDVWVVAAVFTDAAGKIEWRGTSPVADVTIDVMGFIS